MEDCLDKHVNGPRGWSRRTCVDRNIHFISRLLELLQLNVPSVLEYFWILFLIQIAGVTFR